MLKLTKIALTISLSILSFSCVSERVVLYRSTIPLTKSFTGLCIRTVHVVVDYVEQEEIETEVRNSMFAYFTNREDPSAQKSYFLDVTFLERSYMNGIKEIKSLYCTALIYDIHDQLVGGVSRSIQGTGSIVSSVYLQGQIKKLSKKVQKKLFIDEVEK